MITTRKVPPARGCPGGEEEGLSAGRGSRRFARVAGGGREYPAGGLPSQPKRGKIGSCDPIGGMG